MASIIHKERCNVIQNDKTMNYFQLQLEIGEMSVKDNFDTCNKDYVCQTIDPICGACFEYNDGSVSLSLYELAFVPNEIRKPCGEKYINMDDSAGIDVG